MTAIVIPDSVVSIGQKAFQACHSLASVTLGSSVATIGDYAFAECRALGRLTFPKSVTQIGSHAFYACTRLEKIAFAGDAPVIGQGAFTNVTATVLYPACNQRWTGEARQNYGGTLTWTTYDNGHSFGDWITDEEPTCTAVGSKHRVCSYCGQTQTEEIPMTDHHYEDGICVDCGAREKITGVCGDELTWVLTPDGTLIISGRGDMWEFGPGGAPWREYGNSILKVIVEEGVTGISSLAFDRCYALTEITMSDSVTYIGNFTFQTCYSLTRIVIGAGVTSIGNYAFKDCTSLSSITLPDNITNIDALAFAGCSGLRSIVIPDQVSYIHSGAFKDCTNLISITIPESVTYIADQAFLGCDNLWHVLYEGTQEQWDEVIIRAQNDPMERAERHYDCNGDEIVDLDNKVCVLCCEHTRGEAVEVLPTCTESGYSGYICTICGHTVKETQTPAVGHSGDWITDEDPTCTEPGSRHRTCTACGETETEQISATGHSFTEYISDGNATTEADGTKTARCDHGCGATHTVVDEGSQLPPAKITSSVYTIQNGWIRKIPAGTTVAAFLKGINESGVRVMKDGKTVDGSAKIGTGMVVQLVVNGKVMDSLTVVVTGDTNGDGKINIADMLAIKAHLLQKSLLSGAAAQAADINHDGKIIITDFLQIKSYILGKSQIKPTSVEEKPSTAQTVPLTLDGPETPAAAAENTVTVVTMKPMYRIAALVKTKEWIV